MVHSKVYLNKYVVSTAPFSYFAFTRTPIQKTGLFCMFSLFNFSSIFAGGQLTPFAPMCGRPCARGLVGCSVCRVTGCSGEDVSLLVQHVLRLGRGDGGSGV